jgi:hypothetical protein
MKLDFIDTLLLESNDPASITGRTPHPEDAIFDSSQAASQMVAAMESVIENPGSITIKWDGYPALLFGRSARGVFTVRDKYMFDRGFVADSPAKWQQSDLEKKSGKTRPDLYEKLISIWPGLEAAVGNSVGYFWGDLLWSHKLTPIDGNYVFRPNPHGVTYTVPANSEFAKNYITDRTGGIVVHQYIGSEGAMPAQWNGQGLNKTAPVAIVPVTANVAFTLVNPVRLHKNAITKIQQYGNLADKFMSGLDDKGRMAVKQYANKLITRQTTEPIDQWLVNANFTQKLKKFMLGDNQGGYLYRNQKGLAAVFAIWNAVYAFKINLVTQLEKQQQTIGQTINGKPGGEGFVFNTDNGLVKLVNRGVFSAELFAQQG